MHSGKTFFNTFWQTAVGAFAQLQMNATRMFILGHYSPVGLCCVCKWQHSAVASNVKYLYVKCLNWTPDFYLWSDDLRFTQIWPCMGDWALNIMNQSTYHPKYCKALAVLPPCLLSICHLDRLWKPISFHKVSNLLLLFIWRIFLSTNFLLRAHVCVRACAHMCVCVCVCVCVVYECAACMCWLILYVNFWCCKRLVLPCTSTVWAQHKSPLSLSRTPRITKALQSYSLP